MPGNPVAGLFAHVEDRLLGHAPLVALVAEARIQRAPAVLPRGTTLDPYVVYDLISVTDVNFMTARMMSPVLFLAQGVVTGPDLTLGRQIADEIEVALAGSEAMMTPFGVHVGRIWRDAPHYLKQTVDGVTFVYWGGRYRSQVSDL